jgi:asparagine synthase (glutamine-hydrolysing)
MPSRASAIFTGSSDLALSAAAASIRISIRTSRYWDFNYSRADELAESTRPESSYIEEFSSVFEEAVRLRMRADVPVGCYLSGGLDSCAILGFASRLSHSPIEAFTLTFDQAAYDEGEIACEMAKFAGANFHPIPIRQSDIADNFADAIWHSETLCINGHGVAKYLLSRAVRDAGYKVVYTGEGSDEILGGYLHFRMDMLHHNTQGQDAAEIQRLLQQLDNANSVSRAVHMPIGEVGSLKSVETLLGFVPTSMKLSSTGGQPQLTLFSADFRSRFEERATDDDGPNRTFPSNGTAHLAQLGSLVDPLLRSKEGCRRA